MNGSHEDQHGTDTWGDKAVKKTTVFSITYLFLVAAVATGQDAMEFYNRGLKSSLSYKPDYPPLNVPIILKSYIPGAESLKAVRLFGLIGIIVISFALIFQLGLRAPKKKD
jgi:hypothetical protein